MPNDLGSRNGAMRLQCKRCGWVPPGNMTVEVAQMHFKMDHDTDEITFDLVAVCTCGEAMEHTETRPTGGGVKDYVRCGIDGNTGYIVRNPADEK